MRTRTLGRTGWQVGELGVGMWGVAGWTGTDPEEAGRALQLAVDLGCTFFDTAWAYGDGASERLLGELVRANPDHPLVVATKLPPRNRQWPSRRGDLLEDTFPPDHIREYAERSLANLGLDTIDLLQFHTWEDDWAGDERWQRAVAALRDEGLIRAVGVSINRWEPWNALRTLETGLVDAVQVIYNVFDQAPEDELLPACRERDVAVIARVPFDEGSLTGVLTHDTTWPEGDWRATYFVPENLHATVDRVEALRPLVPVGMTIAELALRFVLSSPDVATVIPGMRRERNVRANAGAAEAGRLPDELLGALRGHRWDREPTEWSQ
ncbi:MAG: aldo/keto reductase [Thermoleophilia bacterium]|nr:aldo/keto reductase [Thermoleophilia bacterium]